MGFVWFGNCIGFVSVNTHRGVKFFIPLNIELFDFSLKAEVWRNEAKGAEHRGMAAPLAVRVPQTKRKR
jgi:hypothetical protein